MNTYKKNLLHRLKIVRGHMDKVIGMVENDEYCLSVTQQSQAVQSSLRKVDELLLEHHLKHCVREAIVSDKQVDEKIEEIVEVFRRK